MTRALVVLLCTGCSLANASGVAEERAGMGVCADLIDQDLDGRFDCADEDCAGDSRCPSADSVAEVRLERTCSRGWASAELGPGRGGGLCEPWRRDRARSEECGLDLQVGVGDGDVACVAVGSRTGSDACALPFPQPAELRYVQVGATGGDGSYERPYGTLEEAAADPTTEVILLDGDVVEPVVLDRGLTLRGRCPSRARLLAGVQLDGEGTTLSDVWVRAPDTGGEALRAATGLAEVRTSILEGPVVVEGALSIESSRVRGPLRVEGVGTAGLRDVQLDADAERCVEVSGGASLSTTDTVISRCPAGALRVSGEARVELEHTVFDELVGAEPGEPEPDAIVVECDASEEPCVVVRNSIVRGREGTDTFVGLRLRSGYARLEGSAFPAVRGVPWSGAGEAPEPPLGRALWIEGGQASLEDVLLSGQQSSDSPAREHLPDVLARIDGGSLDLVRVRLQAFARIGIELRGGGLRGNDVRVRELVVPTRTPNAGIHARAGTSVSLRTFEVRDTNPCAFWLERDIALLITSGVITETTSGFCIPRDAYPSSFFSTGMTHDGVSSPVEVR